MKKITFIILLSLYTFSTYAQHKRQATDQDRKYWTDLCYRISAPILENMSKGMLQQHMMVEVSPKWDNRDVKLTYIEAFGRLMAGIAPWLALADDDSAEGKQRARLKKWALLSYSNAVNPQSPDYLLWKGPSQTLVDASFIAQSFIRAPEALWYPLDETTKKRYIQEFKNLRKIQPPYNNWILFRATIEAFLALIDEDVDGFVTRMAVNKMNEWYLGDGMYGDGQLYAFDYYNSFVIQPMFLEILEVLEKKKISSSVSSDLVLKRMQRYNNHLERLISPEGTFPPVGRSLTYRMAAFQPLALAAWKYDMPAGISNGQVRNALTTVMKNMFEMEGNFNKKGYLQLGFVGHQPDIADYYTNNGSLYLTSLIFLPLGLKPEAPFWVDAPEDWTSKKAWKGKPFPKDYSEALVK